jgi:hypothetical protein
MGDDDAPDRPTVSVANLEGTRLLHADRAQAAQRASVALSQRIEVWRPRTAHNADRNLRRAQIEHTARQLRQAQRDVVERNAEQLQQSRRDEADSRRTRSPSPEVDVPGEEVVSGQPTVAGRRVTSVDDDGFRDVVESAPPASRRARETMLNQTDVPQASLDSERNCPVCLDSLVGHGSRVVEWHGRQEVGGDQWCRHRMHRGCLHDAALVSHLCPTCRAPVAANTQRVRRTVDGRIESSAQHRQGVVVEVRHTVVAAPVTQWAPMPAAMLTMASGPRVDTLTQWLARNPNAHREGGSGGASNLLVPLVHHGLRANGVVEGAACGIGPCG